MLFFLCKGVWLKACLHLIVVIVIWFLTASLLCSPQGKVAVKRDSLSNCVKTVLQFSCSQKPNVGKRFLQESGHTLPVCTNFWTFQFDLNQNNMWNISRTTVLTKRPALVPMTRFALGPDQTEHWFSVKTLFGFLNQIQGVKAGYHHDR